MRMSPSFFPVPWGRARALGVGLLLAALASGCGGSALAAMAEQGKWEALRKELQGLAPKGGVDAGEARSIARGVARAELSDKDAKTVLSSLGRLEACSGELEDPIRKLAERDDELGAAALLVLIDAGKEGLGGAADRARGRVEALRDDPKAAPWRAVWARTRVGEDAGGERRRLYVDGDEDVRVGALRAAAAARDPADVEVLAETARVDPAPLARSLAVRALGGIGGEKVVLALHDLWPRADKSLRGAIAEAWAAPACAAAGGARELALVVAKEHGTAAIAAAAALQRLGGEEAREGLAALLRAVKLGATEDRVYAVSVIPLDEDDAVSAVREAAADEDEAIQVAAIHRLVALLDRKGAAAPKDVARADLTAKLEKMAQGEGARALQAKLALARMNDPRAAALLAKDLDAKDALARATATRGFAALGDFGKAALGLADTSASVRATAVCAVLSR